MQPAPFSRNPIIVFFFVFGDTAVSVRAVPAPDNQPNRALATAYLELVLAVYALADHHIQKTQSPIEIIQKNTSNAREGKFDRGGRAGEGRQAERRTNAFDENIMCVMDKWVFFLYNSVATSIYPC